MIKVSSKRTTIGWIGTGVMGTPMCLHLMKKGYQPMQTPYMLNRGAMGGAVNLNDFEEVIYKIDGEDLYLIATSEHPLIGQFINQTVQGKKLPVLQTSYSMCFRKEIGSHGIDEKGIYRTHQFNKQEMIVICEPEDSYKWYDKMLDYSIELFKALEIPIRILECCSGDLGDLKAKSADLEAWSPRQKKYYEITIM